MRQLAILLTAGISVASCAKADRNTEADRQTLMQVSRDWAKAAGSGDIERIVGYWADDATVLAPDQPAAVGKEAIRKFVRESVSIPGFSITWEPEHATISADGNFGYMLERNTVTFADSAGTVHTQHAKAVTIWRKNAAGEWKCIVDTWNNDPA